MVSQSPAESGLVESSSANETSAPSSDEDNPKDHFLYGQFLTRLVFTFLHTVDDVVSLVCAAGSVALVYAFTRWIFVIAGIGEAQLTYSVLKAVFLFMEVTLLLGFLFHRLRNPLQPAEYANKLNRPERTTGSATSARIVRRLESVSVSRGRRILSQYLSFLNVFKFLTVLFNRKVPAKLKYAIIYLWLIVLFGLIYSVLPPGDFYYANSNRDLMATADPVSGDITVREDTMRIGRELEHEIVEAFLKENKAGQKSIRTFQKEHVGDEALVDEWTIDADAIKVLFLKGTNKGRGGVDISFSLDVRLTHKTSEAAQTRRVYILPTVTFDASEVAVELAAEGSSEPKISKSVGVELPESPYWDKQSDFKIVEALFPTHSAQSELATGPRTSSSLPKPIMPVSTRLNASILILGKGILGEPTSLPGNFQRMLYFSAATITPVGTIDISPLTTRSRVLVLTERVMGIILIGLFLNALVAEPRKH